MRGPGRNLEGIAVPDDQVCQRTGFHRTGAGHAEDLSRHAGDRGHRRLVGKAVGYGVARDPTQTMCEMRSTPLGERYADPRAVQAQRTVGTDLQTIKVRWQIVDRIHENGNVYRGDLIRNHPGFRGAQKGRAQTMLPNDAEYGADVRGAVHFEEDKQLAIECAAQHLQIRRGDREPAQLARDVRPTVGAEQARILQNLAQPEIEPRASSFVLSVTAGAHQERGRSIPYRLLVDQIDPNCLARDESPARQHDGRGEPTGACHGDDERVGIEAVLDAQRRAHGIGILTERRLHGRFDHTHVAHA